LAAAGFPRSQNVALVPSAAGQQDFGGVLPTSGFPDGYAPTFTNVSPESIRDAPTDPLVAGGFDTVVLVGICRIADFLANPQFKSRIEGFVSRGGKLIIWDSECQATDYSNFAIPFQTSNPGAAGAFGTLTDAEDNTLSSTNPASPSYVNVEAVSTGTDAVGDANVFTTFDPRWFVDLRATNTLGTTGPVQAYANLGDGLVIYNGLDKDAAGSGGFDPMSTNGRVHLNRIWLLDLLQPWNPDELPHSIRVIDGANTEGSAIPLNGPTTPVTRPTTISWVVTPGPDVDPGTTCSLANPSVVIIPGTSAPAQGSPTVANGGFVVGPQPGAPLSSLTCTDDGEFLVDETVSDGVNPPVTTRRTIRIVNARAAVTILGPRAGSTIILGSALPLTAAFADPGTNDTHTCLVRWGDGSSSVGVVRESRGEGACDASHVYDSPGQFVITVSVRDDDEVAAVNAQQGSAASSVGGATTVIRAT
jgi:hypothetical protein